MPGELIAAGGLDLLDGLTFLDPIDPGARRVGVVCLQARSTVSKTDPRRRYRLFALDPALAVNATTRGVFLRVVAACSALDDRDYVTRAVDVETGEVFEHFTDGDDAVFVRSFDRVFYGDAEWLASIAGIAVGEIASLSAPSAGKRTHEPAPAGQGGSANARDFPTHEPAKDTGVLSRVLARLRELVLKIVSPLRGWLERRMRRKLPPFSGMWLSAGKLARLLPAARARSARKPVGSKPAEVDVPAVPAYRPADIAIGATARPEPDLFAHEAEVFVTTDDQEMAHFNLAGFACICDAAGNVDFVKVSNIRHRKAKLKEFNAILKSAGCNPRRGKSKVETFAVSFGPGYETDGSYWLMRALGDWSRNCGLPACFVTHFRQLDDGVSGRIPAHAHVLAMIPTDGLPRLHDSLLAQVGGEGRRP